MVLNMSRAITTIHFTSREEKKILIDDFLWGKFGIPLSFFIRRFLMKALAGDKRYISILEEIKSEVSNYRKSRVVKPKTTQ